HDVHWLDSVAVRHEKLHSRDVCRTEVDLADLAWFFGQFVKDLEAEALALATEFQADHLSPRRGGVTDRFGRGGGRVAERIEHPPIHYPGVHHLRAARGLVDGPVDVLAVGFEFAEERRVGLVDILGSYRDADRGAVLPGGLGKLADDQGG